MDDSSETSGTSTANFYEVLGPFGQWSPPVTESELIELLRNDTQMRDARIREVMSGSEFFLGDNPLLRSLLGAQTNKPIAVPFGHGIDFTRTGTSVESTHDENMRDGSPRMRGCPNCKRLVNSESTICAACGHVFRARFDQAVTPIRAEIGGQRHGTESTSPAYLRALPPQEADRDRYTYRNTGYESPLPSDSSGFDPYGDLARRDRIVLQEFARQRAQFVWWAILGLFFGASLFSLLLTVYGIVRIHTIRQKVAELGIDPDMWTAYESRRFWRANWPYLGALGLIVVASAIATVLQFGMLLNSMAHLANDAP